MSTATQDAPASTALETIGRRTPHGEEPAIETHFDLTSADATYAGLSAQPVNDAQATILTRGVNDDEVDIRPDGLVYMGHNRIRQRLNEAFRPGGWGLRRLTSITVNVATDAQANNAAELIMSAEFGLYAEGRFLASARGEMKYFDNGEMTYGDALEGTKSNALTRCCKDLGIALDLWDRAWGDQWKLRHAVKVWVQGKTKPQWRKVDAVPFYRESGLAEDSPNRDRYVAPDGARGVPAPPPPAPRPQPPAAPPRDREPGEDDDPGQPPAHHDDESRQSAAPRPQGGSGRLISEGQRRRLYALAMQAGHNVDTYRDLVRSFGFDDDRQATMNRYDEMVTAAQTGPRRR